MKTITVEDLKRNVSAILARAEKGESFVVTRHRKPVAEISSAALRHLHIGTRFGAARLAPAVKNGSSGKYLTTLDDDRRGGAER